MSTTKLKAGDRVQIKADATVTHWIASSPRVKPHPLAGLSATVETIYDAGDGEVIEVGIMSRGGEWTVPVSDIER